MGVKSFDNGCLQAIGRLAAASHLSILVGAGASMAAALPGWESLVLRLLRSSAGAKAQEVAKLLADTQGYLLAAEAAFSPNASSDQRKRRVRQALYEAKPLTSLVPSKLHQAVARLAAGRTPADLQIFSTNYDDLLEQALEDEGVSCAPRFDSSNKIKPPRFPIHHIHGYLGPRSERRSKPASSETWPAQPGERPRFQKCAGI